MKTRNKGLRTIRVADIIDNPDNFRSHPADQKKAFAATVDAIGFYGYPDVYECDGGLRLIDGELRKYHLLERHGDDATIEVNVTDFDDREAKIALATKDPLAALADNDDLASLELIDDDELKRLFAEVQDILLEDFEPGPTLKERFIMPPFSRLDTRDGDWLKRKREWLSLGIQSELGRDVGADSRIGPKIGAKYASQGFQESISVFDPVLCELMYSWFCPKAGQVADPFAGGSVRGFVAEKMGYKYWGCELSAAQVDANRKQIEGPEWICGDSVHEMKNAPDADFIFSCPPYGNLEVYSDDSRDLSTKSLGDFLNSMSVIIDASYERLRDDRFACFCVGEYRDKAGDFVGFVPSIIEMFRKSGFSFYNEAILICSDGNAGIRAARIFNAGRKLIKTHQNVLVFLKGDARKATTAIKDSDASGAIPTDTLSDKLEE